MHVRAVGIIFYLIYLGDQLNRNGVTRKIKLKRFAITVLITSLVYLFFQSVLLSPIRNTEVSFYKRSFFEYFGIDTFFQNSITYFTYFLYFFEQEAPWYVNICLKSIAVISLLVVVVVSFRRNKLSIMGVSLVSYLLILLVWPDRSTPTRYLLPVLPLLLHYLLNGLNLTTKSFFAHNNIAILFILAILLSSNFNTLVLNKSEKNLIGPLDSLLSADYRKITEVTHPNSIIAFSKPLVINLQCDRNSYALTPKTFDEALRQADYFLISKSKLLNGIFLSQNGFKPLHGDTITLKYFYLIKRTS
jgi:hypothetical protein